MLLTFENYTLTVLEIPPRCLNGQLRAIKQTCIRSVRMGSLNLDTSFLAPRVNLK